MAHAGAVEPALKRARLDKEAHDGSTADEAQDGTTAGGCGAARAGGEWSYRGKLILAPMVRINTLPMRRLALKYGADIVYSEELIDHKLMTCSRVVDEDSGHAKFLDKSGRQVFETYAGEPVVVQLGTSDATRALKAASVVAAHVRGIDINMGCPLKFSVAGGMGSALLRNPENVRDILTTLRRNLTIPVTAKIRLLEDPADSLRLAQIIEHCGVAALAVHARYVPDRSHSSTARWAAVRPISDALAIPVIANGDACLELNAAKAGLHEMQAATGCASVMVARAAMWNCSVFRAAVAQRACLLAPAPVATAGHVATAAAQEEDQEEARVLPLYDVALAYMDECLASNNHFNNSKYCLQEMLKGHRRITSSPVFQSHISRGKTLATLREGLLRLADDSLAGAGSAKAMRGAYTFPARLSAKGSENG